MPTYNPNLHWIVMPVHNALSLTMQAVPSLLAQDIPGGVALLVIDNDSSDGTRPWLRSLGFANRVEVITIRPQQGVAHAWNVALDALLGNGIPPEPFALVVNNDVVLRPDTYRRLADYDGPFVTGIGNSDPACIQPPFPEPRPEAIRPHPDFSCFLIRREVWKRVGRFDENFRLAYGEDADYHCRMQSVGITAVAIDLPFLHVDAGSGTLKSASPAEREIISRQAEANRAYFKTKWGFGIGSPEYYEWFGHGKPE